MYSRANIDKHPIHPMLVPLPLTSLVLAPIALIVYLVSTSGFWLVAAYWLSIFGVVTGLIAAVPGLIDYLTIPRHAAAKGIATLHLLLNVSVVVLALVSWLLLGGPNGTGDAVSAPLALVLLLVGLVMLGVSGWLGGELVYRHGIAVAPMEELARRAEAAERDRRRAA